MGGRRVCFDLFSSDNFIELDFVFNRYDLDFRPFAIFSAGPNIVELGDLEIQISLKTENGAN